MRKSNGTVTADSILVSGGTANPLAIDADGIIYCATHTNLEKQCYGENGSDDVALMMMESIGVEEFDEEGMPATVIGFVRSNNNLVEDDMKDIASDDVAEFEKAFEDYANANVIGFTVVE